MELSLRGFSAYSRAHERRNSPLATVLTPPFMGPFVFFFRAWITDLFPDVRRGARAERRSTMEPSDGAAREAVSVARLHEFMSANG